MPRKRVVWWEKLEKEISDIEMILEKMEEEVEKMRDKQYKVEEKLRTKREQCEHEYAEGRRVTLSCIIAPPEAVIEYQCKKCGELVH